jgi:hypothetical protein
MSQMPQGPSHDQPKEIPVEVTVGKIMENFNQPRCTARNCHLKCID